MENITDVSNESTDVIQLINMNKQFKLVKIYQYKDCRVIYSITKCNKLHISASAPDRKVTPIELVCIFRLLTNKSLKDFEFLRMPRGIYLIEKENENECLHKCLECSMKS